MHRSLARNEQEMSLSLNQRTILQLLFGKRKRYEETFTRNECFIIKVKQNKIKVNIEIYNNIDKSLFSSSKFFKKWPQ